MLVNISDSSMFLSWVPAKLSLSGKDFGNLGSLLPKSQFRVHLFLRLLMQDVMFCTKAFMVHHGTCNEFIEFYSSKQAILMTNLSRHDSMVAVDAVRCLAETTAGFDEHTIISYSNSLNKRLLWGILGRYKYGVHWVI